MTKHPTKAEFGQWCDELADLLLEAGLADGVGADLGDRTATVELFQEQVLALTRVVRAGLRP